MTSGTVAPVQQHVRPLSNQPVRYCSIGHKAEIFMAGSPSIYLVEFHATVARRPTQTIVPRRTILSSLILSSAYQRRDRTVSGSICGHEDTPRGGCLSAECGTDRRQIFRGSSRDLGGVGGGSHVHDCAIRRRAPHTLQPRIPPGRCSVALLVQLSWLCNECQSRR